MSSWRGGRTLTAAVVLAAVLGTAACSSSGSPAATSAPASPSDVASLPGASAASTAVVQSPAASSSSPAPSASATDTTASLTAKLLTPAEVGTGFTEATYDAKDGTSPCDPKGTPGIDEQVPPKIKVGRDFVLASAQAQLEEDLQAYASSATADKAMAAVLEGLKCTTGMLYASDGSSTKVTISKPQPLTAGAEIQGGDVWALKGPQVTGTAVLIKYGDTHLALFTFFAPAGGDTSKLPDVQTIITMALTKILS